MSDLSSKERQIGNFAHIGLKGNLSTDSNLKTNNPFQVQSVELAEESLRLTKELLSDVDSRITHLEQSLRDARNAQSMLEDMASHTAHIIEQSKKSNH